MKRKRHTHTHKRKVDTHRAWFALAVVAILALCTLFSFMLIAGALIMTGSP